MEEALLKDKKEQNTIREYQGFLYETYYQEVFRTIYYIIKDIEISKELSNDTFFIAFTKVHTLQSDEKFKQWICVIASNQAKSYLRKNKKVISTDFLELDRLSYKRELKGNIVEDIIEKEETREKIKQAIHQLPPKFKEIIVLRYYLDLSYEEISEQLTVNLNTIKTRIHRAKKKIHRILIEEGVI